MRIEQIIKNSYYNPKTGFQSSAKLYKKLKIKYPEITHSKISDVINAQQTHQIHTIAKLTTEHYNQTKALGFGEIQMDLLDLSVYKSQNNGYRYILMATDIYSRKLFTRPLKTKSARETLNATKLIEKEMEPIKIESIILDKGKEYNNSLFKTHFKDAILFFKEPDIFNSGLAIVDRYCRTFRDIFKRYITAHATTRYISILQKITDNINNTENSTTKHTPNDIWNGIAVNEETQRDTIKLQQGDTVRIRQNPVEFTKKITPRYSNEVFIIERLDGLGYRLSGKRKKYFVSELLKVESPETLDTVRTRRSLHETPE